MGGGKSDLMAFMGMVVIQFVFAGMNIISKVAMDSGLKPFVFVAYRQIFAALTIAPLAYFFEWKTLPRITKPVLFKISIASLVGTSGNQILYFTGLQYSSPTIGCALSNLLPAFTFILAILFRQEHLSKRASCVAKVVGTAVCVGGAMLLSFYHGRVIGLAHSGVHWKFLQPPDERANGNQSKVALGSLLIIASCICWAYWFVLQVRISKEFQAPYTTTLLMSLIGSVACTSIGFSAFHSLADWSLKSPTTLITVLYSGVMCTGIAYSFTCWCIQRKGALYVSVYTPLLLVIVAVTSIVLLREKLYVGTVVGSVLIILGLYSVLWGKHREANVLIKDTAKPAKEDLESQSIGNQYPNASN